MRTLTNRLTDPGATGITTGLRGLDELTGGWQEEDLIIIAARRSMGRRPARCISQRPQQALALAD